MKNNKFKSKRTEATLSLIVTGALVITLAICVASAIRKGSVSEEHNNIVNLNETEGSNLSANNEQLNNDTLPLEDVKNAVDGKSDSKTANKDSLLPDSDLESDLDSPDSSDMKTANEEVTVAGDVPVAAPDSVTTSYSFSEADTLHMPVNGEIILPYNMDNTIWFPTLGVYKCNPGLYISSEVGTNVCASAPGTVANVSFNEELGNVVTIDMGNGYMASYGQLENISVASGEVILSGQILGTVASPTVYYTTEGSGVYFKLTKNNAPENPLEYME